MIVLFRKLRESILKLRPPHYFYRLEELELVLNSIRHRLKHWIKLACKIDSGNPASGLFAVEHVRRKVGLTAVSMACELTSDS